MKLHSMTINIPKTHKTPSVFKLERYWNIYDDSQLNKAMSMLRFWTHSDGIGRVLCYGRPIKTGEKQKRLFIVKKGHDGKMWAVVTAKGAELKRKLA